MATLTKGYLGTRPLTLRVGLGQNGQEGFISGEQHSLNVAGDSAKTLSVLGNMGGVADDCGLRFVQKWRRPPRNTPDFGGPTIFSKNYRKKTPLAFDYTRPYMPPRCYFHSDIPPGTSNTKRMALKKPQGGRRRRHRHRRAIAYIFSYIGEKRKSPVPCTFLVQDFEGAGPVGV